MLAKRLALPALPALPGALPGALVTSLVALAWAAGPAHAAPFPVASLTANPSSPVRGASVTFTSTSTASPAAQPIVRHEWDLDGNGTFEADTAGVPQATGSYAAAGVVVVALRVTDSHGKSSTASLPVTVRYEGAPLPPPPSPSDTRPPTASFIFSPSSPRPGEVITFASVSSDPGAGGAIAQESWDLNGDSVFGDAVGRSATAAFAVGGHAVSLRVTDRAGNQSVFTQSVDVTPDPGIAAAQIPGRTFRLMRPFPVVRIAGSYTAGGVRVRLFSVAASSRATVVARCSGRRCPYRRKRFGPRAPGKATAARTLRLRKLERWYPSGVRLVVMVTRSGEVGKYTRFKIRRLKPPARVDRCLSPGTSRPIRCPGA
jgi:PKD repeat protein